MLTFQPLTEFDFHQALDRTEGPALVLFSSPACGTCRTVEKRLPQAAQGAAAALFKVDVQQSIGLARAYDIFHLPALFLFVDGQFHARLDCEVAPVKLAAAMEMALSQPAQEEP